MSDVTTTSPRPELSTLGVVNPYALAASRLRRRVAWDKAPDPGALIAETLGQPMERLVDPKYDTTLYPGLRFNAATKRLERVPKAKAAKVAALPEGAAWVDVGDFYQTATELTDPVQGGVADCYYIAALASVAWARTYVVAQRTRATDAGSGFVDMVPFFDSSKGDWVNVEVSEKVPVWTPGNYFLYARSAEPGEIWPACYEKAFAKWRTNDASDTPDIEAIAYGDPVWAVHVLIGGTPTYYWTPDLTADAVWQKVRENSVSAKTFNPMVAWTYGSADSAPDPIDFGAAGLVANHAYSIVGWDYRRGAKYIVLRNPWGNTEPTLNILNGHWVSFDAPYYGGPGFWRAIDLGVTDGIFSLRVDTFKQYFSGFGFVS